jgi:predicted TIM-barrel fold metal-dependent hydrolase
VIDVSVLIGGGPRAQPPSDYGLEAATRALREHGLGTALIASRTGGAYRHEVGNDLALEAAGPANGVKVRPVATLNPVQYLEWPAELERVLAAGVVGLRFFPELQGWSVRDAAFGAMAEAVGGRCPLLLPITRYGDASAIGAATDGLETPVVLVGGHYTQLGDCLAAMERWPHLYLETSRLAQFRGVETVVRSAGADRLLFGSGAPARPVQAALNAVLAADIPDAARRAILGGNASRLFGVPVDVVDFDLDAPRAILGEGLIDVHAHVGSLGFPVPPVAPGEHPAVVAHYGIERSVASSLRAIVDDGCAGNADMLAACQRVGEFLRGYVVLNPHDLEAACRDMDAAYQMDEVVGAKVHSSWSGSPTASSGSMQLLREVARRGRPLKIHVDGPEWDLALRDVATAFPHWKVIVAHAGPGTPSRATARLVESTPNVYVELSTSFPELPIVREVVRVAQDRGRLLFGSDAPLLDPAYVIGIYADAGAALHETVGAAREVFGL